MKVHLWSMGKLVCSKFSQMHIKYCCLLMRYALCSLCNMSLLLSLSTVCHHSQDCCLHLFICLLILEFSQFGYNGRCPMFRFFRQKKCDFRCRCSACTAALFCHRWSPSSFSSTSTGLLRSLCIWQRAAARKLLLLCRRCQPETISWMPPDDWPIAPM